ncbi:SgcJ/EcaC family oxidoreductase [Planomonospora sp. ID67723]|uniref:SgcJ/EcaC family oxidoreductase n=1 Tax=Planomonospora sp. ID67723 TaxID=2738134 RepID=UPI0018C4206E|nr:SgcJ/EcaC family oxidoreductase [Planomonospora sp. ID67723]MBG0829127.1 SgcJ/EcaC family oxidoreductase [Planomonospora sp. ID67723]
MSPTPTATDDTTAIGGVPQRIIAAWARNDGDAFAEVFTEDATMILPGDIFVTGRENIRTFMGMAYAGPYKGTRVTGAPVSVKLLGPDAAVLVTRGGVLTGDETEVAPERAVRATWVLAKQDGQWLITAYQNTPAAA